MIAGLLALTVIAISAAGIAARDAASATRQHAIALSRQLAGESLALASTDFVTAGRLAVTAWRVFPTDQARSAMTALLADQHPDDILPGAPPVSGVAFSRDGELLAAAADHGTVRLDPAIDHAVGVPWVIPAGGRGERVASARTASWWPPLSGRTVRRGIWPPARPSAFPCRLIPARRAG